MNILKEIENNINSFIRDKRMFMLSPEEDKKVINIQNSNSSIFKDESNCSKNIKDDDSFNNQDNNTLNIED